MVDPYTPPFSDVGGGSGPPFVEEYEFQGTENAVIERTARLARAWGILSLVAGVLFLLMLIGTIGLLVMAMSTAETSGDDAAALGIVIGIVAVAFGPLAIVHLATGWYYVGAGTAFRDIVETSGRDVEMLLQGLERMAAAFKLEVIFIIIAIVMSFGIQIASVVLDAMQQRGG